jgi:hypothetical protein
MSSGRTVWKEVYLVAAVGVVVALIVAVGLTVAVKVTLSSIQSAQNSTVKTGPNDPLGQGGGVPASSTLPAGSSSPQAITVKPAVRSAKRHEVVQLVGRYSPPGAREVLHVQLRQHHRWITFPLPAVSDPSGRFSAFVELGRQGPNRLRVIDRRTGQVSGTAVVNVR